MSPRKNGQGPSTKSKGPKDGRGGGKGRNAKDKKGSGKKTGGKKGKC